jgi:hypothetical protein
VSGRSTGGQVAEKARHLPFTRLERRKPLIERGRFSHVAEHKSNSSGAADASGNWKNVGYPAFCKRLWLTGE